MRGAPVEPVIASPDPREALPPPEVRRRALRGAVTLVGRGTALRALGLLTQLVLTRVLAPHSYGMLALGLTVVAFADLFVMGGLGSALVRRAEPPRRSELQGVLALQLMVGTALAALSVAVAAPLGTTGVVTAIMVLALPIAALRTPSFIVAERRLEFGPIVVAEVLETVVYAVLAVGAALAGLGVYGVAAAGVVRAFTGSAWLRRVVPAGRLWPRFRWRTVQPILAFGAQFQAAAVIDVVRNQLLNVGVAALAGLSVLGLWGLAARLLYAPMILFEALWRVSFPAVARLLDAGEDVRETLIRATSSLSVAVGVVLVAMAAGAADLVPALFGEPWAGAAPAVALPCLGLLLSGPVSVASSGYLYARGDAAAVLRVMGTSAAVCVAVALGLVAASGQAWGVGVGQLCGALVESVLFLGATRRHGLAGLAPRALGPAGCGIVAAAAGWLVADAVDGHVVGAAAAILTAEAVFGVALWVFDARSLRETVRLGHRALGGAVA